MKTLDWLLLVLLLNSCSPEMRSNVSQNRKQEIHFSTHHIGYALIEYGSDSIKLSRPLQYIKSSYQIVYELNKEGLVVYKPEANAASHNILFKTRLINSQTSKFYQAINRINQDSIRLVATGIVHEFSA